MNPSLVKHFESLLSEKAGKNILIDKYISLGGGSINDAYKLETNNGSFFVKINDASAFPEMFDAESKGLQLLKESCRMKIPGVIYNGEFESNNFLLLEFIENKNTSPSCYHDFGIMLAELHCKSNTVFGLDHNNYIGSLRQSNSFHSSWIEFFVQERLSPQIKLAFDDKKITRSLVSSFEKFYNLLPELFPIEAPALLHGDLWSGNFMTTENDEPCMFDPAVYYGHREMDIAMTKLFGGFLEDFYLSYNDTFPLEKGWQKRITICNLYPLLVHVNLFGGSYVNSVESAIRPYVKLSS